MVPTPSGRCDADGHLDAHAFDRLSHHFLALEVCRSGAERGGDKAQASAEADYEVGQPSTHRDPRSGGAERRVPGGCDEGQGHRILASGKGPDCRTLRQTAERSGDLESQGRCRAFPRLKLRASRQAGRGGISLRRVAGLLGQVCEDSRRSRRDVSPLADTPVPGKNPSNRLVSSTAVQAIGRRPSTRANRYSP